MFCHLLLNLRIPSHQTPSDLGLLCNVYPYCVDVVYSSKKKSTLAGTLCAGSLSEINKPREDIFHHSDSAYTNVFIA